MNTLKLCVLFIASFCIFGCTEYEREKQLTKVARDWSQVITASQIIPVYPLTEDLRPGDILLVDKSVEDQRNTYREKGFLPLDRHLVRLCPSHSPVEQDAESPADHNLYADFYGPDNSFSPPPLVQKVEDGDSIKTIWSKVPYASFPPYTFTVRTAQQVNLAFPIQGVPMALGYMNTGNATGSVQLSGAHTYGLDIISMERMIRKWGLSHRDILSSYPPYKGWTYPHFRLPTGDNWCPIYFPEKYTFLRVIYRVYAIEKIRVTIKNEEHTDFSGAAGVSLSTQKTDPNVTFSLSGNVDQALKLNEYTRKAKIGANVNFEAATLRSITFNETLKRPLVIGYIGFDLPILEGGRLGRPISTLEQLESGNPTPSIGTPQGIDNIYGHAALIDMQDALKKVGTKEADNMALRLDRIARLIPEKYPFDVYPGLGNSVKQGSPIVNRENFSHVADYIKKLSDTKKYCQKHGIECIDVQVEYNRICNEICRDPSYVEAIDYLYFGY